jgi:hypothetical protein
MRAIVSLRSAIGNIWKIKIPIINATIKNTISLI